MYKGLKLINYKVVGKNVYLLRQSAQYTTTRGSTTTKQNAIVYVNVKQRKVMDFLITAMLLEQMRQPARELVKYNGVLLNKPSDVK